MLVGIMMRGQEVGTLDVRRDADGFLFPLDGFVELTGASLETVGGEAISHGDLARHGRARRGRS